MINEAVKTIIFTTATGMLLMAITILLLLTSCTYSVILNHTQGEASDVVDQNQKAYPDIKPNISIVPNA